VRLSGFDIKFSLSYYNKLFYPNFPELQRHSGPACIISVLVNPVWSSRIVSDCEPANVIGEPHSYCVSRYYYGITVTYSTTGVFGYFDLRTLILAVGSMFAYFSLPGLIIGAMTLYLLGPISDFYRCRIERKLKADDECCALVCRALASSSSFQQGLMDDNSQKMTKETMLALVQQAFSRIEGLELQDQAQLSELVFDRLTEKDKGGVEGIELPVFAMNTCHKDFGETLHELFRENRRMWPLEYVFAPHWQTHRKAALFRRNTRGGLDMLALQHAIENTMSVRRDHLAEATA